MVYQKMRMFRGVDRWANRGKLMARYMGPYPITERIEVVAYRLELPPQFVAFHYVFHVSIAQESRHKDIAHYLVVTKRLRI